MLMLLLLVIRCHRAVIRREGGRGDVEGGTLIVYASWLQG